MCLSVYYYCNLANRLQEVFCNHPLLRLDGSTSLLVSGLLGFRLQDCAEAQQRRKNEKTRPSVIVIYDRVIGGKNSGKTEQT